MASVAPVILAVVRHWSRVAPSPTVTELPSALGAVWRVTSGDRSYVVKRHESLDRLDQEQRVLRHLAERDVPVSVPVPTDDGQLVGDGAYTLAPALLGGAPTIGDARAVGRALGRLHSALADFPGRVETYTIPQGDLPLQLVHGDFHSGNVLVSDGEVTGFVDFANLCYAPRVHDVARYLVDQVLWVVAGPDEREQPFRAAMADLVDGYRLTERERAVLVPAMRESARSLGEWLRDTPGLPWDWPAQGAAAVRWIDDRL